MPCCSHASVEVDTVCSVFGRDTCGFLCCSLEQSYYGLEVLCIVTFLLSWFSAREKQSFILAFYLSVLVEVLRLMVSSALSLGVYEANRKASELTSVSFLGI